MAMDTYAVIWFEGPDTFTLVDRKGRLVKMTAKEVSNSETIVSTLKTQADVEEALDGLKYAITLDLLENLFGCDVE